MAEDIDPATLRLVKSCGELLAEVGTRSITDADVDRILEQVGKGGSGREKLAAMASYLKGVEKGQAQINELHYKLGQAVEAARQQEAAEHSGVRGICLILLSCVVCLGTIIGMSVLNSYCGDIGLATDLAKCARTLPWSDFVRDFWSAVLCLTTLYRNDQHSGVSSVLSAMSVLLCFRNKKLWYLFLLVAAGALVPDTVKVLLNVASHGPVSEGTFRTPQRVENLGAQLAAAAYAKDARELDDLLAAVSMRRLEFHQQPKSSNPIQPPQYFVAEQASKTKALWAPDALWVVFRGAWSASVFLDLLSFLDFEEAAMTGCQMHSGYLQAVDSLKELRRTLDRKQHVGKDIYLVGHSLGGGMALAYSGAGLLPTRSKCSDTSNCRKPKHKVLTYGAPNIFANDHCSNRTATGTSISQFVHAADPMPRLLGANSAQTLKVVLQLLELDISLFGKVAGKLDSYRVAKHAKHFYLNGSTGVLEVDTDGVKNLLDLQRAVKMTAVADHHVNAYVRGLHMGSA